MTTTADVLRQPLQYLSGVGPKRAEALRRCGLATVWDAINNFPFRHEDRRAITLVNQLENGTPATVYGLVDVVRVRQTRQRKSIVSIAVKDATGALEAVWFNQPWMRDKFHQGDKVLLTGKPQNVPFPTMNSPLYEVMPEDFFADDYEGVVAPIYRVTEDISVRVMRQVIHAALACALPHIDEYFPDKVLQQYNLMPLPDAYRAIHAYNIAAGELTQTVLTRARRRLVLDEFFVIAMGLLLKRRRTEQLPYTTRHTPPGELTRRFIGQLPFQLTSAQRSVLSEIKHDMLARVPMNRLLQGDVGSGKTVVALTAALMAIEGGYQVALMAPTELLAQQHYKTITKLLDGLPVMVNLLTGSTPARARRPILAELDAGHPQVLIGTHALIQSGVNLPRLGLAIIDEQHKFGVMQRNRLRDQSEQTDVLVMTATPIPRSLALTVYGDLCVSKIDEMPHGRRPIKTYVVKPERLPRVWSFIRQETAKGHQAYIVYPLIDESEALQLKPATAMYEELRTTVFSDLRVGLVHGRISAQEKEATMQAFSSGAIDVLVCTTVIEVGIDVPNATVMVIEEAHRFGLAQLHQLRGRIGRGAAASYCILVDGSVPEEAAPTPRRGAPRAPQQVELLETNPLSRLAVMAQTHDGFVVAEEDLKLRGPGEFFGIQQTGLPALHIADLIKDEEELKQARHLAETLIDYRDSLKPETRERLRARLLRAFGATIRGVDAG
jgi:ATP-dependent DNA helicase RecG